MAEKKRDRLTQRIGIGIFLGILSVGVGLGVYEGFDAKKEKTPVVRDVEVTDKSVHNKGKNDSSSTLVEAVHKDKNGRVLVRVLGKDKDEAERLLAKTLAKRAKRDAKLDAEYAKAMEKARKIVSGDGEMSESKSYALLEKDVTNLFGMRFGADRAEVTRRLASYDESPDHLTYSKVVGMFTVKVTLTMTKDDRVEGYSMRVGSEDVAVLQNSSDRVRTLLSLTERGKGERVVVGVRGLVEKKAYVILNTGR